VPKHQCLSRRLVDGGVVSTTKRDQAEPEQTLLACPTGVVVYAGQGQANAGNSQSVSIAAHQGTQDVQVEGFAQEAVGPELLRFQ
jgi:hypothetical protein